MRVGRFAKENTPAGKIGRHTQQREPPILRWVRRTPKWLRRLTVTAGLTTALAAVPFFAPLVGGTLPPAMKTARPGQLGAEMAFRNRT